MCWDSTLLFVMGTSRPILWNKNLRSLCVSAGWMYILSVCIFLNGQLIIHMMLSNAVYFKTFVVPLCCVTHMSHGIYTAVSGWRKYISVQLGKMSSKTRAGPGISKLKTGFNYIKSTCTYSFKLNFTHMNQYALRVY